VVEITCGGLQAGGADRGAAVVNTLPR